MRRDVGDAEGLVVVLNVVTLSPAVVVRLHQVAVWRRVVLVVEDHGVAIHLQEAVVGRRVAEVGEVSGGSGRFHGGRALLQKVRGDEEAVFQRALALIVGAVEEGAVHVVVMSPQQFALAAVVVVLAFDEETVGEVNMPVLRQAADESAAAVGRARIFRVVDESVIDAARDLAFLTVGRVVYVTHDAAYSDVRAEGVAIVLGADLGAHVAVADGEAALGTAHQTAQVGIGAALNQSRHVKVADGGAVGVLEGGAIHCNGSGLEVQRVTLAVEGSLERMHHARHRCHADVGGEFDGLAAEAVDVSIILYALAEVVPPVGVLDGIGVVILCKVGVRWERERAAEGHVLIGHGEGVGIVAVVADAAADAQVRVVARHGQRRHAFAHLRREGDGDAFARQGSRLVDA